MSSGPKRRWTEAEYLAFERASHEKHELIDGEIVAMSGASENHNLIATSTLSSLFTQLRKGSCKIYPSDMRVRVGKYRQYTYPNMSIVSGKPIFADDQKDTLLNPTAIIEVHSPSTEGYDRGDKFALYRTLNTLQEYTLISQNRVRIERYVRQPDNQWLLSEIQQLDDRMELTSVGCTLTADDVYEHINFENTINDEIS